VQLTPRLYVPCARLGAAVALLAVAAAQADAQAVTKASYMAEGSFQLPAKGQPGSPDRPAALCVAPDRTVHIVDGRGAVFVFDSAGVYRRSYGAAQLDRPVAIDIAPSGEIYVLDAGRNQVYVFGPGGQGVRRIGEKGSRGGQLSDPLDMALGPAGNVYILDRGRSGVQVFSWDGTFVRDITLGDPIRDPVSLAVGNDGWIYVADKRTPTHIYAFPPFTELPWAGPTPRGIAGRVTLRGANFDEPVATEVNDLGTVVVLDKKVGRLFRRNASSEAEIGPNDLLYGGIGTGRGSFREAVDVAFAATDQLLILDERLRKVERIRLTTEDALARRPDSRFPIRVTRVARGLAAPLLSVGYGPDGSPQFLLKIENRAVTLMGARTEALETVYGDSVRSHLADPTVLQQQYSQNLGEVAAAAVADTTVIVVDSRRNRFAIFDRGTGRLLGTFGDNYQDDRRLRNPRALALLPDGRIIIGDTDNDRVKIFSPDLASLVASFPVAKPAGIAVAPDGEIYVWNEDGTVVGHLVTAAQRLEPLPEGLLAGPVADMTFDHAGNLFVLNGATHRITIIQAGLDEVLMQLGAEGALNRPNRIRLDRDGNIYVADEGADRTFVFRWDVHTPPLAGFDLDFEGAGAVLRWQPGPRGFTAGYEVQGADNPAGPYRLIARAEAPPLRLEAASIESPPRYVRVAPVFITGVRGRATEPLPLLYFTARSAYEQQNYEAALREAEEAIRLIDEGVLDAGEEAKGRILFLGFASAYMLRDFRLAVDWAQQAAAIPMPREQFIEFLFMAAEVYLQLGNPRQASQEILTLVGQGPRPEYYMRSDVIDQSFRIYRGVRGAGLAEDALEFVRLYTQSIPTSIPDLVRAYEDSIIVFETRDRLDNGIRYWRNADYGQVVSFFEQLLTEGNMSSEQMVVGRQILAAAYYAFGNRVRAEDTFREIFNIRPEFNLDREIARLRRLYSLTIYNPETQRFFGAIRRRP
jgi:DNA-binding beta-propeller fold protein YncE/tetratricopeptide (TPR) repeat protein